MLGDNFSTASGVVEHLARESVCWLDRPASYNNDCKRPSFLINYYHETCLCLTKLSN